MLNAVRGVQAEVLGSFAVLQKARKDTLKDSQVAKDSKDMFLVRVVFVAVAGLSWLSIVAGHGQLIQPRSRNSVD